MLQIAVSDDEGFHVPVRPWGSDSEQRRHELHLYRSVGHIREQEALFAGMIGGASAGPSSSSAAGAQPREAFYVVHWLLGAPRYAT